MLAVPPYSTWLFSQLQQMIPQEPDTEDSDVEMPYFIFDFPGQAELITNEPYLAQLTALLEKNLHFRLAAICLTDASTAISTKERLVSSKLFALAAMAAIELPFINILSKADLLTPQEREELTLERLHPELEHASYDSDRLEGEIYCSHIDESHHFSRSNGYGGHQQRLWSRLEELVDDLPYLHHILVAVEDKDSMLHVLRAVDRANGYAFGGLTAGNDSIMGIVAQDL